jgi:hypothetical protein
MFLNIITPCSRPENLEIISKSINIPRDQYRWIVVFDLLEAPENIPDNCEWYTIKDANSTSGNAQRNFALNLITHGHIYFNDDDTVMHIDLWNNIKNENNKDFISFKQSNKDMQFVELQDKLRKRIMTVFQINDTELGYTSEVNKNASEVQSKLDAALKEFSDI